jgi:GT2 family glycosyltransferase
VVDNGSTDGSPELVREKHPWARLHDTGANLGFGPAVNLVAERTASEWIAPCNADVALHEGALSRLLEAGDRQPRAGVIAPRLELPDGSTQHSVYRFPTLGFTLMFNLGVHRLRPSLANSWCLVGGWDPERPREVDWAIAAFLLVRREAWNQVGGFSDQQWMYAEDLDLAWRLRKRGWSTRYLPTAVVLHESGASAGQAWGRGQSTQWMRSTYAWMLRTRGSLRMRATGLINFLGAGTRLLGLSLLAKASPSRWARERDGMRELTRAHATAFQSSASLRSHR